MFIQAQVQFKHFKVKSFLLSPFPEDQEIDKNAVFQTPRASQQHNSPRSQGMPFAEAALIKQGEAELRGRAPPRILLRAAIHSLIISFCW